MNEFGFGLPVLEYVDRVGWCLVGSLCTSVLNITKYYKQNTSSVALRYLFMCHLCLYTNKINCKDS